MLGLLALGALVIILALAFGGLGQGIGPISQGRPSPTQAGAQPPYPPAGTPAGQPSPPVLSKATQTASQPAYPAPWTPAPTGGPKPTPAPTSIPTATPIPTALPLPPSAFYAVWAESFPEDMGSPWGVIWLADPRDIAGRREVVRVEKQGISSAVLSPDGRQVAFTTGVWGQRVIPLWVVNVDGTDLRQAVEDAGQILWSCDGRALFNTVGELFESKTEKEKVEGWVGIERVDLASGERRRILTIDFLAAEQSPALQLLGWSAGGKWLYYLCRVAEGYELWKINQDGHTIHLTTFPRTERTPRFSLSPGGDGLLIETFGELKWVSVDGKQWRDIPLPRPGQSCSALWAPDGNQIIVSQMDEQQPIMHVHAVDVLTGRSQAFGDFRPLPGGHGLGILGVSPDRQWLVVSEFVGFYFVHVPTEAAVLVPIQDRRVFFTAWVPREVVGW